MRGGVLQLHRWGLLDALEAAGTPIVRTTSFHYGDDVIDVAIKPRDGIEGLYAPRRYVLDALLVDAAKEAGAEFTFGVRVVDVIRSGDGRLTGVVTKDADDNVMRVGAETVIGADGLRSTVAAHVGAEPYRLGRHCTGVIYGYWSGLGLDGYHWYYRPGVSVGAIPTNDGQTCVFASMPAERFHGQIRFDVAAGFHRVVSEVSPELAAVVAEAERFGNYRGFPGQVGFFRQSWGRGWALVGDAGYFKDPLTAHGITDAFRDAELLARAVAKGSDDALAEYQNSRDEMALGLFNITDDIASFEWDLPAVMKLHRSLSDEMKREVVAMAELDRDSTIMVCEREAS
jgi:2-polyprenyl-6-methoxyphenol hydroxylase-like FAD-dependent oxidoreductase